MTLFALIFLFISYFFLFSSCSSLSYLVFKKIGFNFAIVIVVVENKTSKIKRNPKKYLIRRTKNGYISTLDLFIILFSLVFFRKSLKEILFRLASN